ncbi:MAG: hypothetical protein PWQ79_152 [Thermococcaceae archaeon]|nr:hypothetical protein [Thermococcaceae archaeon]
MRGSVPASSTKSFTLQWTAVQGEHSYGVRLYEVVGGQELEVDGWSGGVSVAANPSSGMKMRLECPSRVGLGEGFACIVHVVNNNPTAVKVQLNNITLCGEVTYEEADINYKRFENLEGIFYLSTFKEVPPHSSREIPINLGKVDDGFASHFGLSDNHDLLSSTVRGNINTYTIYQIAYWDTEYSIILRFDVFDENDGVIFNNKALKASTTLFYTGSAQEKYDHDMRVQRLKNFGKNVIKIIVTIILISKSGDKLWEFVKSFWG